MAGGLVKYIAGALTRYQNSYHANHEQRGAGATGTAGGGEAAGILRYYLPGIDWTRPSDITSDQLVEMRDFIEANTWFIENIETIKEIFEDYIEIEVQKAKFDAWALEKGLKAAQTIDGAQFQVMKALLGYKNNRGKLAKDYDNHVLQLNAELEDYYQISDATLQSRLQTNAHRKQIRLQILAEAPDLAARLIEAQERKKAQRDQLKDQLKNGSGGSVASQVKNQKSSGNWLGNAWNSFIGK